MIDIQSIIREYTAAFPDEALRQLIDFISKTPDEADLLLRTNNIGHITASGFVISPTHSKVLLVNHQVLDRLLQPGGHIKPEDRSIRDAAIREIKEKTSIKPESLTYLPFHFDYDVPIDIDTHRIPAIPRLKEEIHYHHDFRYVFICEDEDLDALVKNEKGDEFRWVPLEYLYTQTTFIRIVPKIQRILSTEFRPKKFFDTLAKEMNLDRRICTIAVAHFIPDVLPYLRTLCRITGVAALIPKPNSIDDKIHRILEPEFQIKKTSREEIQTTNLISDLIAKADQEVVLMDIGGYFAPVINGLAEKHPGKIIGVVEDTENGHQKYESVGDLSLPVYSVARSPLKDNEDFLVGQSVLFSADVIMREVGKLIQYLNCSVFGYGKIGSSIAYHLLLRGVKPNVFDTNAVRRIKAYNQLCAVPDRQSILRNSDVLFCATGNRALDIQDFRALKPGCFIFSVTSSDDEMDLEFLSGEYNGDEVTQYITRYSNFNNYFFLVNKGNAVNFIHKAVLGDFINLVRGEMLYALKPLLSGGVQPGIHELTPEQRQEVAAIWARSFIDDKARFIDVS